MYRPLPRDYFDTEENWKTWRLTVWKLLAQDLFVCIQYVCSIAGSLTIIPSVMKRMAPPRQWRMKKVAGRPRSLAGLQQQNQLPWPGETGILWGLSFHLNREVTNTYVHAVPWSLSSVGLVLDRESLDSRCGLLLEQGSSLSWYINASTAAGTGSCQDTHTHTHTHPPTHTHEEAIVKQVNSEQIVTLSS